MAFGDLTISGSLRSLHNIDKIGNCGAGSRSNNEDETSGSIGYNFLEHGNNQVHTAIMPGGDITTLGRKLNFET